VPQLPGGTEFVTAKLYSFRPVVASLKFSCRRPRVRPRDCQGWVRRWWRDRDAAGPEAGDGRLPRPMASVHHRLQ
jgi:hypothetical protein